MYFPYEKGRYEVAPGLIPLPENAKVFEIGADFAQFRAQLEKNRASGEPLSKYVCMAENADPAAVGAAAAFIARKLAEEYPDIIHLVEQRGMIHFSSRLTHDSFKLDPSTNSVSDVKSNLGLKNAWDAMGAQVPEDLAIWRLKEDGSEDIEALHLNAPNHWAAEEKIGRSFSEVHAPVAGIEKIVPWAVNLLKGILERGPFVRFAWGVGTDNRLNHHPQPPPGVDPVEWMGRRFDPHDPKLFARVERQVLWRIPNTSRVLFTIRTYFHDVAELKHTRPEAVQGLKAAIDSMSAQSLKYKGLDRDKANIIHWLDQK